MYSVIANLPIPLILFAKRNLTARAIFIIGLPMAVQQCLKAFVEERGDGLRSKTHESVLFERSEFTGECAEQLIESRELCTAARRSRGYRGAARRKASTHRFCAAKLLALKSIGFLMTGKKKARRNAPAFQALFSQHGAKRLTFKRCLLAFLWAQFAFLLQAFSFSNKKKMPKRGKYTSFD